jgi:hypothetical protein
MEVKHGGASSCGVRKGVGERGGRVEQDWSSQTSAGACIIIIIVENSHRSHLSTLLLLGAND